MAAADVDEPGVSEGDETKNKVNFHTYELGRDLLFGRSGTTGLEAGLLQRMICTIAKFYLVGKN